MSYNADIKRFKALWRLADDSTNEIEIVALQA